MKSLIAILIVVCCVGALLLSPASDRSASATTVPVVRFAIFRFEASTHTFIGFYELTQEYRKALPDPGELQATNLLFTIIPAGDFGSVDVDSRLTGGRILEATMIWQGTGTFVYPPSSVMWKVMQHGFTNPAPEAVISPGVGPAIDIDAAWALVADTDVISRVAAKGTYEVYAWVHEYATGGSVPKNELFIVAANHPAAPPDMAMLEVAWPRTLVTRGVPTTPEILIHNFSDEPEDPRVRLAVTGGPGDYQSTQPIGSLPGDQSLAVTMPSLNIRDYDARTFVTSFRTNGGGKWLDQFPDNDTATRTIHVTDEPVFRHTPSIPRDAVPCDFDDDGDIDLVTRTLFLGLLQNDGTGNFTDVTVLSSLPVKYHPRLAVCADFDGDTHSDLFVSYYGQTGLMLKGNGAGVFTDVTDAAGMSGVTTYERMVAVDKENDGDLDLVIASLGQESVLENDGSGHFTDVTAASGVVDAGRTQGLAAGDLNADNYPDLVLANLGQDSAVFINDGDGTFTRLNRAWSLTYQGDVVLFDLDGDNDNDIYFVSASFYGSRLFRNDGNLDFTEVAAPASGFPGGTMVDAGDFNEDGRTDLVFTTGKLLMNTPDALEDMTALLAELVPQQQRLGDSVYFADLDNDGDLDVCGEVRSYLNQGVQPRNVGPPPGTELNTLEPNFPNPFNPSTTIRYHVGTSGHVTLKVYNVVGQLVRTLVSEAGHAVGDGEVVWDGRDNQGQYVATGVYLCRLVAPGGAQTRKLVLLK